MPFITSFIVLSLTGIINAGYLTRQHFKKKPLVCPLNHDCGVVTESKWAKILGVRNEVLGLLFFIFMFSGILAVVLFPQIAPTINILLILASGAGLFYSIFLTGIQIFVIKDYCFYCLISALITLLIFINSFFY